MQPYDSAESGAWLSQATGKPWVADLLDPWALDEMMVYPSSWHRARERTRMRKTLASASAIVMNTPEAVERVRSTFPELGGIPVVSISNGFDPSDFGPNAVERPEGPFRIVHTGYLHTELGLQHRSRASIRRFVGGAVPGLDIYTRSHVFLLEAIDRLIRRDPTLATKLEVHLAGVLSDGDREIASRSPVVHLHGYVDHPETVSLQRSADLLFLPMHDLPPGSRTTIVPGKTWEYIASGRPILAAVPDGDARDTLEAVGTAILVRPQDVTAMAEAIASELSRVQSGAPAPAPDRELVDRYAYPRLTAELARVFDSVLGVDRSPSPAALAS